MNGIPNSFLIIHCLGGKSLSSSSGLVGQVFFNLLIVLTPIYVYQLLFSSTNKKLVTVLSGVLFGLASIISMTFPIIFGHYEGVFLWDLRWVPFVICVLYMGPVAGAISGLLLVIYRFTLGGVVAGLLVLTTAIILYVSFLYLRKSFHDYSIGKKYVTKVFAAVYSFTIVFGAICLHFTYLGRVDFMHSQGLTLYMILGASYVISMVVYTYFTENTLASIRLREHVHKAEKLNIVSELAASIAHEVRNPLTVVRGFIQLTKIKVDKTLQSYMDTAIHELDRAEQIISDYLNFAKPQLESKTEKFNMSKALEELILLMQSYANIKGIPLIQNIEEELYIIGDHFKFKQAILNLTKNAIEATEHGQVEVTASFSEKKQMITIQVKDTGTGMTSEQLQRLGDPYYTTKSQGTGLGLMVTFRLIESIGGTLKFESALGKGTKAMFVIKGTRKEITTLINEGTSNIGA